MDPHKSFKLPKATGLIIGSILILAASFAGAYFLPKLIPQIKAPKIVSSTPNYSLNLNKTIKKIFSASNRYQDVVQLNEAAYAEKDLNKKYKDYLLLFRKISQDYTQTKKVEFKAILFQLKDYMRAFPQFKEREFVIPK